MNSVKIKIFRSIGLAAILTGGILLTACGPESETPNTTPPSQETPAKTDLEKRAEEYENFILDLSNATSLTVEEGNQKVELQENKLKLTQGSASRYVETAEGESFEYVFDGGGYTKNPYSGDMTAASYQASLLLTVDVGGWTEVDAQGKLTKTGYSAEFNKDAKTLSFTSPEHTITIYDVGQTQVTLPEVTDPVEEFKITAENIGQVKSAVAQHIDKLNSAMATPVTTENLISVYLKKSENGKFIDTIGAIYTAKQNKSGSTIFYWNELTIPTQEDLTYERFYKNEVSTNYRMSATTLNRIYMFSCYDENDYSEMTDTLKSQTFKDDYTNCQWSGWTYTQGMSSDAHVIACYSNGRIEERTLRIKKDNSNMSVTLAVDKNFKGKEESDSTYKIYESKTLQVESTDKQFLVVEQTKTA